MTGTPPLSSAELQRLAQESLTPAEYAELVACLQVLVSTQEPDWSSLCFPEQRRYIEDDSRFKLLLCTRRAGKSYVDGIELFRDAYRSPGVSCLYVGLTRSEAKRIMVKDVLDELNYGLGLGAVLNKSDFTYTLPNKSVIYIIGVDSSEKEKRKAYGQKQKRVVIDEAALYEIDLAEFVYSVLKPSTVDHGGSITMSGMPSNIHRGLFFELTQGQRPTAPGTWESTDVQHGTVWRGHRWSAWQNPYTADQWRADIEQMRLVNPLIDATPVYQEQYLGEWAIDDSKLVYRYRRAVNDYVARPPLSPERWRYLLGVDLGFNDESAYVVGAYHPEDPVLYLLCAQKLAGQDITAVAGTIHGLRGQHKFDKMIIDGSNKQAVEEMRRRHNLPGLEAAEKQGKMEHIAIMNGDFVSQRIKLSEACEPLKLEYTQLIRDPRSDIPRELEGLPNHCADAALYLYRYARTWMGKPSDPVPQHGSPAWAAQQEAQMRAQQALQTQARDGNPAAVRALLNQQLKRQPWKR